jgi:DNA repair exonuclease SbcCD ATPase subunit
VRIKRLSFRNVGPFGEDGVTLDGFSRGLNVVCETNEFGKSTILKALEMVLFKPFSGADKTLKALRSAGSENPLEGEIIFSVDGREYRLFKRFLKQKMARLEDAKTGETLAIDRSAEERVAELLRSDRYQGGPSGLLWVRQGTSMDGVADDGQIASRLEGELGTLIGGARGRDYLARVESELAKILTHSGQEKKHGPLRNAREAVQSTKAELQDAERLYALTTSYGVELEKVTADIDRLLRDAADTKRPEQIKETQNAMMAGQSFANELELVEAKYMQAVNAAERAGQRQAEHVQALISFNETSNQLMQASEALQNSCVKTEAAQAERNECAARVSELEAGLQEAAQRQTKRETYTRDTQRLALLNKDRVQLSARLEHLNDLQGELETLTQSMSDLPAIGRRDVEALRRAADDLRQSESDLAALSTRLYLDLSIEGAGKVTLEGQILEGGPIELMGGQALSIEGVGELKSDDRNLRETTSKRDGAKAEYTEMLARFEVSDASNASKIADDRYNIEQARKRAAAEIARLAPQGRRAMEAEATSLETEAQGLVDTLAEIGSELTEGDNDESFEALRQARAKLELIDEELGHSRRAVAQAETLQAKLNERLNGLGLPRDEAAQKSQADKYASDKLKTESDMRALLAEVEAVKSRAPEQSLEMLQARLQRLEQSAQQAQQRLDQLRVNEASLRARRDAAFEGGDAQTTVGALKGRLETEQNELARQIRAKDVRVLLRDTLVATQTRLREAYTAPIKEELAPLLSRVIPGAEAGLSENLGVDTVLRNGRREALTQLSGGTQEQFAILTRLAYARLLGKSGASAPVILDDALVYADDARRDAMFDVLGLVSSGERPIQIIYLSCHAGATTHLGGTRLTPKSWPMVSM